MLEIVIKKLEDYEKEGILFYPEDKTFDDVLKDVKDHLENKALTADNIKDFSVWFQDSIYMLSDSMIHDLEKTLFFELTNS